LGVVGVPAATVVSFGAATNTALTPVAANAFSVDAVVSAFNASGAVTDVSVTAGDDESTPYAVSLKIGGVEFSGSIGSTSAANSTLTLQTADKSATVALSLTDVALEEGEATAYETELADALDGVTFTSALDLKGGVSGAYRGATVAVVGGNFQMDLKIGNEIYRGSIGGSATANTTTGSATPIVFTSQTNGNNKFSLVLGTATPALSDTNALIVRNALDTTFGASLAGGGTLGTVNFKAAQVAQTVGAGLLKVGEADFSNIVRSSSATAADTYTLTTHYIAANPAQGTAEKVVFRLQDTKGNVSEAELKSESGTDNDTISFGNGINLKLDAASINTMSTTSIGSSDATAVRFSVADGESTILKFQTGIASTDTLSIGFDAVNVKSLGLTGINMETNAKAAEAVDKIDAALARVNLLSANIGALQSRLDFTQDINATSLENYQGANSVIRDADLSAVLTDLSQASLRNNVATAILSQANQTPTQSVSRLLQGL
jgi:flagellin